MINKHMKDIVFWGIVSLFAIAAFYGVSQDIALENKVDYLIETHNIDPKVFE